MESKKGAAGALGRRQTLQLLGVSFAAGGLLGAVGCKSKEGGSTEGGKAESGAKAQDCKASIDEASRTTRRTLQYVDKAAVPEKNCIACAQFTPEQYGACGGGCKVITGPVKPEGGCLAFAPKTAPAASPGLGSRVPPGPLRRPKRPPAGGHGGAYAGQRYAFEGRRRRRARSNRWAGNDALRKASVQR